MKKYTIVYNKFWSTGSHCQSITRFDRIETDDLAKFIMQEKYNGKWCFIFEEWPKEEREE